MSAARVKLPEFQAPPINEVVLGVQSAPIEGLTASHLGLYWREIRDAFPKTEEQPALDPMIERFGDNPLASQPGFRILAKPETPRVWFISADETQLIQLQNDRLHHNWRKRRDTDEYPRYERLRSDFHADLVRLERFLQREQLGALRPSQCEISYINDISPDSVSRQHHELEKVFTVWRGLDRGFLPPPENGQFQLRFIIRGDDGKSPVGRLHVTVVPALRRRDLTVTFRMELTARGNPEGEGMDGVLRFLDRGHEWIVRAFAQMTTQSMHAIWGRTDG